MKRILIVEDDAAFGQMLKTWLQKKGYQVEAVSTVSDAQKKITSFSTDLVLSDLRLPDGDGIMLLQWIKEIRSDTAVIIMTNYADIQTAVSSIRLGAFDYVEKPIQTDILATKIANALNTEKIASPSKSKENRSDFILGQDELSQKLYEHISLVAPTNMSVLITGESGTGKEYVAKQIHANSKRKEKPFIAVDCGAISKELGASELFGHLKGSFTSAVNDKRGVFEEADGGTIFLDEIGNLSVDVQMQLLRALQERKIKAVGNTKEIAVDVRILSATNENLHKAIEEGRFREDLFHRINEFALQVPALRDRGADILIFANMFLKDANTELEKSIQGFTPQVQKIFKQYHWSGNLREMRNIIKRAVLFCTGSFIDTKDLSDEILENKTEIHSDSPLRRSDEKEIILEVLKKAGNNKKKAAEMLGIDRKTLYNKMGRYGIEL